MTRTDYEQIADEVDEIAKRLAAAQTMIGTSTLDGLLIAKNHLDIAQAKMTELSERLNLKIDKEAK